jgi:hypothetical protein
METPTGTVRVFPIPTEQRIRHMRRLIILAALVALVTTACKIETNFGAVINADGSGTLIVEMGMDEEAQSFFLQDGSDPFDDQDMSDFPDARQRQERRGDMDFWIVEPTSTTSPPKPATFWPSTTHCSRASASPSPTRW